MQVSNFRYDSLEYEDRLDLIDHYKICPEMKVWVGCNYPNNNKKLLLVGESHYLKEASDYHHDPESWYAGVTVSNKDDWGWIKTRKIISNGIQTKWGNRSKAIYRNIEKALFESTMFKEKPLTAFTEVAFMNYFQRPAEKTGRSIIVSQKDAEISSAVFKSVIKVIMPDMVIFTSSLAWQHAKKHGIVEFLNESGVAFSRTPHPGMPWWNKAAKAYKNQTGKEHFIEFINDKVAINLSA